MQNELRETVSTYLKKYGHTLDQKLGLTRDDLLNDIREQIWKGLLTHSPSGRANLKTYLNTLIKNRFGVLFKRSKILKNNMVNYYSDVYATTGIEDEHLITEETGETLFMQRQVIMQHQAALCVQDRIIYEELLLGNNLHEIESKLELTRPVIIGAINRIDTIIRARSSKGDL